MTILLGLLGVVLIVATVSVIGLVVRTHWRQRRWAFLVVDLLLVVGAGLIASRPIGQALERLGR